MLARRLSSKAQVTSLRGLRVEDSESDPTRFSRSQVLSTVTAREAGAHNDASPVRNLLHSSSFLEAWEGEDVGAQRHPWVSLSPGQDSRKVQASCPVCPAFQRFQLPRQRPLLSAPPAELLTPPLPREFGGPLAASSTAWGEAHTSPVGSDSRASRPSSTRVPPSAAISAPHAPLPASTPRVPPAQTTLPPAPPPLPSHCHTVLQNSTSAHRPCVPALERGLSPTRRPPCALAVASLCPCVCVSHSFLT